jgi:hypothetical protein
MSIVPDYLRRQVVEGEREPDLLVPERLLWCVVHAIEEQMSVKRRIVEILERQEEDS